MFNFIKKIRSVNCKRNSPSEKLCDDIQRDYLCTFEKENFEQSNQKRILEKDLIINGNKYYIIPVSPSNTSFDLVVKDEYGEEVFCATIIYGIYCSERGRHSKNNEHILYIDKFRRKTQCRKGIGREMAKYIRELAESRGFTIIGAHIVASFNPFNNTMQQEELEAFYKKYLNGKNVKFVPMNNSDCIDSVDWNR